MLNTREVPKRKVFVGKADVCDVDAHGAFILWTLLAQQRVGQSRLARSLSSNQAQSHARHRRSPELPC